MRVALLLVALLAGEVYCCTFNPGEKWQKTTYTEGHVMYFGPGQGGIVQAYEGVEPVNMADFFVYDQANSNLTVTVRASPWSCAGCTPDALEQMVSTATGCAIGETIIYTLSFAPTCDVAVLYRVTGSDVCDPLGGEHRLVGCTEANDERCFLSEGNFFVEIDDDDGELLEIFIGPRSNVGDSSPLSVVEYVGRSNATVFMRWEADKYYVPTSSGPNTHFEATIAGLSKPGAGIETPQTTPSFCSSAYSYAYEFLGPNCNHISFLLQEGSSCVDTISGLGDTTARHVCLNPLQEYWSGSYWIYWSLFAQPSGQSPSTPSHSSDSTTVTESAAVVVSPGILLATVLSVLVVL